MLTFLLCVDNSARWRGGGAKAPQKRSALPTSTEMWSAGGEGHARGQEARAWGDRLFSASLLPPVQHLESAAATGWNPRESARNSPRFKIRQGRPHVKICSLFFFFFVFRIEKITARVPGYTPYYEIMSTLM